MRQHTRPPAREPNRDGVLMDRARRWTDAHVTFDRIRDVTARCPRCDGLVTRRLGPGVLCGTCGRLWVVREMLDSQTDIQGAA
jgi:hypothetical protein